MHLLFLSGKYCMNLVDTDRSLYAREHGYRTSLCSLKPLSCTPKNNLIIGQRDSWYHTIKEKTVLTKDSTQVSLVCFLIVMYIKYCTLNILIIKLPSRVNKTRNIFCCYLQWQSHSFKDHPIYGWGWNLSASCSQRAWMLEALGSLHLVKRIDDCIFGKLVSRFLFPHILHWEQISRSFNDDLISIASECINSHLKLSISLQIRFEKDLLHKIKISRIVPLELAL